MSQSHASKSLEIFQRTGVLGQFAKQINIYEDATIIDFYDGSSIKVHTPHGYKYVTPLLTVNRKKWWKWGRR